MKKTRLTILILLIFAGNLIFIQNSDFNKINSKVDSINNVEFKENLVENSPLSNDYTTNSSGEISNINVTLHQAYHNDTLLEIDENSNSFTVPAPNATDFSSSFINISMNDLSVDNVTYTIEDTTQSQYDVGTTQCFASFEAPSNCYLLNASFYTWRKDVENGTMSVWLFASKNQSNIIVPDGSYQRDIGFITVDNNITGDWEIDTFTNVFLDN
ncbi:MAG: hypothetical protein ACTSQB_07570, partial [Candidatus Heimdallarchaeota archaeon]